MADFDVQAARSAGYTDAQIEQYLAMSGVSPKQARAMLGAPAFSPIAALEGAARTLLGTAEAPPQAMTRVTRTPVTWGGQAEGSFGSYNPGSGAIRLDPERLPQWNANPEYMSNVLRHESAHAVIPMQTRDQIEADFNANPAIAAVGRAELSQVDPAAGATNRGLAAEAPAYAVQGYRFGLPDDIVERYKSRMPPAVRKQYEKLLPRIRGGK
jgi:hypothetical protein